MFNRKLSKNGVSEIIGSLLVMAITISLFSSIMFYVSAMPQPSGTTITDFRGSVDFNNKTSVSFINITHMGGESLSFEETRVVILFNDIQKGDYSLANGRLTSNWVVGGVWSIQCVGVHYGDVVRALVYQRNVGDVIWGNTLGYRENNPLPTPPVPPVPPTPEPGYGEFDFTITDSKATITGYHGKGGIVSVPAFIGGGYPVTTIGDSAFQSINGSLATVMFIPDSVTHIGMKAFWGCDVLKSIYFLGNAPDVHPGTNWKKELPTDALGHCTSTALGFPVIGKDFHGLEMGEYI